MRSWSNFITLMCIIIAAIIEAWQQALSSAPKVAEFLPTLDGIWHFVPLGLLIVAGISWLTGGIVKRRSQQAIQNAPNALATPSATFDVSTYFRLAYYSSMQPGVEANVRAAAAQSQPNDKEGFYVKLIAVGAIAYNCDLTWFNIYKSQLVALMELNRNNGWLPLATFRTYYDQAVIDCPKVYANYSFDQWFQFMKDRTLVLKHPSDMVEITLGGKDFLKYLLHWARDVSQRSC